MDNDIFSVFSRLLGFQYTTSTSVFIFFALCFVIGGALLWGLHRFNEYTIEFYLSEIMPATPLERWWSGFIFGSKTFLFLLDRIGLALWIPIGVLLILLSSLTLFLDPANFMDSQNSKFIIFIFGLGVYIVVMGYFLYHHFVAYFSSGQTAVGIGRQRQLLYVSLIWIISVTLVVFSFTHLFNYLDGYVYVFCIFMTIVCILNILREN
jgi:hypothetical protein